MAGLRAVVMRPVPSPDGKQADLLLTEPDGREHQVRCLCRYIGGTGNQRHGWRGEATAPDEFVRQPGCVGVVQADDAGDVGRCFDVGVRGTIDALLISPQTNLATAALTQAPFKTVADGSFT